MPQAVMAGARGLLATPSFVCRSCSRTARSQWRRSYSTSKDDIYDVVCVGGGPAGLSLLTALRMHILRLPNIILVIFSNLHL